AIFSLFASKKIVIKRDGTYLVKGKNRYKAISEEDIIIHEYYYSDPEDIKTQVKTKVFQVLKQEEELEFKSLRQNLQKDVESNKDMIIQVVQEMYNDKKVVIIDKEQEVIKKPENFPDIEGATVISVPKAEGPDGGEPKIDIKQLIMDKLEKENSFVIKEIMAVHEISMEEITNTLNELWNEEEIQLEENGVTYRPDQNQFPDISTTSVISKIELIKTKILSLEGNTRSVFAQIESRMMQTNKVKKFKITLTPDKKMTKNEMLDLIEEFSNGKMELEVELEEFEVK
ncbi:MAG: hypothetical protein ACOC44_19150, partial [Promethearchaeia archaeon]